MYYVYGYFDPLKTDTLPGIDGGLFYVGKGKGRRMKFHLFESSLARDPNKHKTNIIKQIRLAGLEPSIVILEHFSSEEDAFNKEKSLIRDIGRADLGLGPLTNLTDGGEGTSNKIYSAEYRQKLSAATKKAFAEGRMSSNVEAFKYSQLGKKQSASHVENRMRKQRGRTLTETTKAKISDSHKILRQTPEWKQKASAAQSGKKHTAEHTDKCIAGNPKSRPVSIRGRVYLSLNRAMAAENLTPHRLKTDPTFKFL